jgi:hypothetical protein
MNVPEITTLSDNEDFSELAYKISEFIEYRDIKSKKCELFCREILTEILERLNENEN